MDDERSRGMVILAETKVKEALKRYPELKKVLVSLSPKFKKLNNKVVFNLVGRWATFADVAKMGGLSVCELLHRLNSEIGMEKELFWRAPDCIEEKGPAPAGEKPSWVESAQRFIELDVRKREDFFLLEIMEKVEGLHAGEVLRVLNSFYPAPLVNMLSENGYEIFHEAVSLEEHVLYVRGKGAEDKGTLVSDDLKVETAGSVGEVVEDSTVRESVGIEVGAGEEGTLYVSGAEFFSELLGVARNIPQGSAVDIIIPFNPKAVENLLRPYGFVQDASSEESRGNGGVRRIILVPDEQGEGRSRASRGHRIILRKEYDGKVYGDRVPVVIQSATPVVYPLIVKLLLSDRVMDAVKITELKMWDKTEKHLSWIVNGYADITFSAVAAVAKLYRKGLDIKMRGIAVWDNFYLLTRGFEARDFGELRGRKIHLPLIKAAPPYVVTSFLIRRSGYDPTEFDFVFGDPFGRPDEIKQALVSGEIEVAVLREPEASMAIFEGKGKVVESIAFRDVWEKLFPGRGNLPNAGLLFKGDFMRKHPEIANAVEEEVENAVEVVLADPAGSAEEIYALMGMEPEEAGLFLSRVHLEYRRSSEVLEDVLHYLRIVLGGGTESDVGEVGTLFID